jgi:hypothetical protein
MSRRRSLNAVGAEAQAQTHHTRRHTAQVASAICALCIYVYVYMFMCVTTRDGATKPLPSHANLAPYLRSHLLIRMMMHATFQAIRRWLAVSRLRLAAKHMARRADRYMRTVRRRRALWRLRQSTGVDKVWPRHRCKWKCHHCESNRSRQEERVVFSLEAPLDGPKASESCRIYSPNGSKEK